MMCVDLGNLAATLAGTGQLVEARPLIEETIALAEEIGFNWALAKFGVEAQARATRAPRRGGTMKAKEGL